MGTFVEHIQQSQHNLDFLSRLNNSINDRWDWQVTACFYSAVHLINAHIVHKTTKNYLSHNLVSEMINPYNELSVAKLDEDTYKSYTKLQQLSRRSRYLLNENFKKEGVSDLQPACITYDKHFKKSIYHLDVVLKYISRNYAVSFEKCNITCMEMQGLVYENFIVKNGE